MYVEKKCDLAVYYWIKDLFKDAPFITIVAGFPDDNLTIPTVSVDFDSILTQPFELGSRIRAKYRKWSIDVFAENKNQRDEYAFRILHALEDKIPVYDYDLGDPPTSLPKIGVVDPDQISLQIIKVIPDLVEKMYYRSLVEFTADYSDIN